MSQKQEVDINIKIDVANLTTKVSGSGENPKNKIMISIPVAQVAYFMRLLFDSEIIITQSKSDVLGRIAHSLVTKNTPEISIKSLKAKFYTVDPATKESVKKLLIELLNTID